MDQKKKPQGVNPIFVFGGILAGFILIAIIFAFLFQNEMRTIVLLRNEYTILEQQKRIINASSEISEKYKNEIDVLSGIFPTEQSIPLFIQTLEGLIRGASDEYTFKFNSLTPIAEGDKLFLLMTITMKTDLPKLMEFLSSVEHLQYMTHITGIMAKTPEGFAQRSEVSLGMKVYVQNPFTTIK